MVLFAPAPRFIGGMGGLNQATRLLFTNSRKKKVCALLKRSESFGERQNTIRVDVLARATWLPRCYYESGEGRIRAPTTFASNAKALARRHHLRHCL